MRKLTLIILSHLMCFSAFAWRESNGGTGVAAEASQVAHTLLDDIFAIPALTKFYFPKPFDVQSKTNLTLDGQSVDAYTITDTEKEIANTIYVDSDNWNKMSALQKRLLMLHEVTHFMGVTDFAYTSSQMTIDKLEKYEKLKLQYPLSNYPIDTELVATVAKCDLLSFVNVYRLVLDIDYKMPSDNKTIRNLIEESSCTTIKEYAPLKDLMKK